MIYRGPAFSCEVAIFGSSPTPSPLSRQQIVTFSQSSCACVAGRASDGGGGGKSQIIRSRESLAFY
jgi:hypothetical protein